VKQRVAPACMGSGRNMVCWIDFLHVLNEVMLSLDSPHTDVRVLVQDSTIKLD
jgi:hypothetical protein